MIVQTLNTEQIIIRVLIAGILIGAVVAWWIAGLIISVKIWDHKR